MKTIEQAIRDKVVAAFHPVFVDVENESSGHNVPAGSETHFKLTLVTDLFAGLSRVDRQRKVYELLGEERARGLHALAIWTFTPEEWERAPQNMNSPHCMGGGKKS